VCVAGTAIKSTTTLAAQTANNTSTATGFAAQTNGNAGAANVSKVDVHSLLYSGATTKVYAHLLLWFGGSNHMNVGYNSTDAGQIHNQITDMISRGIDGVIIDWYGPDSTIDTATKLVMTEAESHPGFTFAIMIDQGAIQWDSCSGCSPQQALISDLQYIESTYFSSPSYLKMQGKPVITNFDIDLSYSVNWNEVSAALSTQPAFLFQNNDGFSHVLSEGSYSWVMPTTSDYGMSYLASFYNIGIPLKNETTVGATYKGFNDSLAPWGSNRVMGQQCGQTWLKSFSEINGLYNSGKQLSALQLVTWNDYEEGTEIESGINGCLSISASVSTNSLRWTITGKESTVDHYVAYISTDGKNLMSLGEAFPGTSSLNLCSYSVPNASYTFYVQAIGKPSIRNQISPAVKATLTCGASSGGGSAFTLGTSPSSMTIPPGGAGALTVSVAPQSGSFNSAIALTCSGLPGNLKCSFAPGSVTPGAGTASSVLTVSATSARAAMAGHNRQGRLLATWLLGFGLFGVVLTGQIQGRRLLRMMAVAIVVTLILGAISCGGNTVSPSNGSGSPNSYVVTINGNAGSVQLSTTVTVTVK
jgi:hypothetical protein